MATTYPPIDRDVFTGLQAGDERALERLFRDRFPQLVQEADAQLHDPRAETRTVEGVFLQLWAERARFDSPEALESFLHNAVREASAREQSRLASLHRFDSHEGANTRKRAAPGAAPSVDEAWAHVVSRLHAPPPDHAAAARDAMLHSRHAAAEHMAAAAKQEIPWGALAIGAVLAAIVAAGWWWVGRAGEEGRITRALASADARALSARPGQQAVVTLDDGTKATIAAASKLTVPPKFGKDIRAVGLDGAASFTVAPGQDRPFVVRARNASVAATGTTFDVRAYEADSAVVVRVREGEVAVRVGDTSRTLAAGRALAVAGDGKMSEPSAAALSEALGWTEGRLVVAGRPLRAVLPEMSQWYGMNLKVLDSTLLDRRVTINAPIASPREAIAALEGSAGVKFGYIGQNMVLRDTAEVRKAQAQAKGKRRR